MHYGLYSNGLYRSVLYGSLHIGSEAFGNGFAATASGGGIFLLEGVKPPLLVPGCSLKAPPPALSRLGAPSYLICVADAFPNNAATAKDKVYFICIY